MTSRSPRLLWLTALVGLALCGCSGTVRFDESTRLAVPAKLRARVDPTLFRLEERWETWNTSSTAPVGQALTWTLADDPQAPAALTYLSSTLAVETGFALAFYNPNAYEACYTLRLALDRDSQRRLLEGRGRGRSGSYAARASRAAIEEAVLDLYAQLQALGLRGGPQ